MATCINAYYILLSSVTKYAGCATFNVKDICLRSGFLNDFLLDHPIAHHTVDCITPIM